MTAVAIEEMRLTCVRETSVLNVHQYSHSNVGVAVRALTWLFVRRLYPLTTFTSASLAGSGASSVRMRFVELRKRVCCSVAPSRESTLHSRALLLGAYSAAAADHVPMNPGHLRRCPRAAEEARRSSTRSDMPCFVQRVTPLW